MQKEDDRKVSATFLRVSSGSQFRFFRKLLPNGVRDSSAILKCCIPNGMPAIVMQQRIPKNRCAEATSHQPKRIQSTFINMLRHPPAFFPSTTSVPKGHSEKTPNFHSWQPKGIPMTVIMKSKPKRKYTSEISSPPNTSQRMFPMNFIS